MYALPRLCSDFPVEVLERILKYTFVPSSPLTPFSDPFHLRGTSHVLLVSRGVRELALPFFYHTVIIRRSDHYTTFFDPELGLFNDKVTGEERWSFVRQVGIITGVGPPINPNPTIDDEAGFGRSFTALLPLRFPENHRLERFCLLDHPDLVVKLDNDEAFQSLLRLTQGHSSFRENWEEITTEDWESSGADQTLSAWCQSRFGGDTIEHAVDWHIKSDTVSDVRSSREAAVDNLLCMQPEQIQLSPDGIAFLGEDSLADMSGPGHSLVVYSNNTGGVPTEPKDDGTVQDEVDFVSSVLNLQRGLGINRVQLEGFSASCLEEVKVLFQDFAYRRRMFAATWFDGDELYEVTPPVSRALLKG